MAEYLQNAKNNKMEFGFLKWQNKMKILTHYTGFRMLALMIISSGLLFACNNADNDKTTIETKKVEIDSSINTGQDTIRLPDTMASGVSF